MSTKQPLDNAIHEMETQCHRYAGRVVVVTGAARGLGRVIARRLAREGAQVVIADLQAERTVATADALARETGAEIMAFAGDLSRMGVADELCLRAFERFGRIDTFVNNAAALIRMPLADIGEELMQAAVAGNVWTTLRCSKAVLVVMLKQHYGRIVNIGGEAWRTGAPFHTLLAGVGKGSMVGLTATLAGEVAGHGITVNCVSPGGVDSAADGDPFATDSPPRNPDWTPDWVLEEISQMGRASPMGRLAHPAEVASAVAFLGSAEASFITGQHLGVSGGMAML